MAVLLIKLAAGTICLTDGASIDGAFKNLAAADGNSLFLDTPEGQAAADENGGCVLGEAGGCHCACAHTMPLPTVASLCVARMETHFESLAIHSGFKPATTGMLLRPPIA